MEVKEAMQNEKQYKLGEALQKNDKFIENGKFVIQKFDFPPLPSLLNNLNVEVGSQDLLSRNFDYAIHKYANLIGMELAAAFYQIPPLPVLRQIASKFEYSKRFKKLRKNFDLHKQLQPNSAIINYASVGVRSLLIFMFIL